MGRESATKDTGADMAVARCFRCRSLLEGTEFGFCQFCRKDNEEAFAQTPEPPKVTNEPYKRKVRRVAVDQETFHREGVVRPQE